MTRTHQHFRLEISFRDGTDQPVAAYLQVRAGEVSRTEEIEEGVALADYDADGLLLGVELLSACPWEILDRLIQGEPAPIQRFVRGVAPHSFVTAPAGV